MTDPGRAGTGGGAPVLVGIGGSAGSVEPLLELVRGLPAGLPATVLVTIHLGDNGRSRLAELLGRRAAVPVSWAADGEPLPTGEVRVAPPRFHLLAEGPRVRVRGGPRINRHRPSVDALLFSLARSAGPRGVAVVLSGTLDDGAVGSAMVSAAGGQVLVQDPGTAEFPGMPSAALAAAPGGRTIDGDLAAAVTEAVRSASCGGDLATRRTEAAMTMADSGRLDYRETDESRLTRLVCPECGGSLAQVDLPQISYFRCHVGHHYGPQTLAAAQADTTESKLWSAVAALEEQANFSNYLVDAARDPADGAEQARRADRLARRARELRDLVQEWSPVRDSDQPEGELS